MTAKNHSPPARSLRRTQCTNLWVVYNCALSKLRGLGAITHHLLKQAVVALPLVGHVRSPRGDCVSCGSRWTRLHYLQTASLGGIASPAGAAGQGCIIYKLPALPTQSAQGIPKWKPLFMGWQYTTPSRRLPAQTCHRQLCRRCRGGTNRSTPVWLGVVIHDALFRKRGEHF